MAPRKHTTTTTQITPKHTTMARTTTGSCSFLDLSPELRNRIYRYAVTRRKRIHVRSTGYARPSLLSTCRQIRYEALAMYYVHNNFSVNPTSGFDSTLAYRFETTLPGFTKALPLTVQRTAKWTPNWENLLLWLERFHNQEVVGVDFGEGTLMKTDWVVVGRLFWAVEELRDFLPWGKVKKYVMAQQAELVELDSRWGNEGAGRVEEL